MSKKNKTRKVRLNTPNNSQQLVTPREKLKIRIELLAFSSVTLILMLIIYKEDINGSGMPLLFRTLWGAVISILLGLRAGGNQVILKSISKGRDETNPSFYLKLKKGMRLLSTIILAFIIFPAIYYSPLHEQILQLLISLRLFSNSAVSNISNAALAILATLSGYIGNIILGALGNLFYDFVKTIYNKIRPENTKRQTKTKRKK